MLQKHVTTTPTFPLGCHSHVGDGREGRHDEEQDGAPLGDRRVLDAGLVNLLGGHLADLELLGNLYGLGLGILERAD